MLNRLQGVFKSLQDHEVHYLVIGGDLTNPEELLANEITIFNDRVRIDVQTATPGLDFDEAWGRRESMSYQDQPLYVVSREDLVASKRAAGRPTDLEDVRVLELAEGDVPPAR